MRGNRHGGKRARDAHLEVGRAVQRLLQQRARLRPPVAEVGAHDPVALAVGIERQGVQRIREVLQVGDAGANRRDVRLRTAEILTRGERGERVGVRPDREQHVVQVVTEACGERADHGKSVGLAHARLGVATRGHIPQDDRAAETAVERADGHLERRVAAVRTRAAIGRRGRTRAERPNLHAVQRRGRRLVGSTLRRAVPREERRDDVTVDGIDQAGEAAADQGRLALAEHPRRGAIGAEDDASGVGADDGIGCRVEHRAQLRRVGVRRMHHHVVLDDQEHPFGDQPDTPLGGIGELAGLRGEEHEIRTQPRAPLQREHLHRANALRMQRLCSEGPLELRAPAYIGHRHRGQFGRTLRLERDAEDRGKVARNSVNGGGDAPAVMHEVQHAARALRQTSRDLRKPLGGGDRVAGAQDLVVLLDRLDPREDIRAIDLVWPAALWHGGSLQL